MPKIRVLVVDDSPTFRKHLVAVLGAEPGFEVVGEASDGHDALALCRALRPDAVTLDLVLPGMNGIEATEQIMAYCPTPILIVSSPSNREGRFQIEQALAAGAVDALDKAAEPVADWERQLVTRLKLVSRIQVITHPRAKLRPSPLQPQPGAVEPRSPRFEVVAMGASTGGPGAVLEVLRRLPPDFSVPILLVLHLGERFGPLFAEWLGTQSGFPVSLATDGLALPACGAPSVLLAPPGWHMTLEGGQLRLSNGPERHACRPSVDVLFESVAEALGERAIGCLLTGMGRDGAAGLLAMRRAGGATLAQDEATSIVYGMPREAARLGAAGAVLPLEAIGPAIDALVSGNTQENSA